MHRALIAGVAASCLAACAAKRSNEPDGGPGGDPGDPGTTDGGGAPGDPQGFSATATSQTTVALSWQAVPGALGYLLERHTGSAEFAPIATLGPTDTSFVDQSLAGGTAYIYRLRTLVAFGLSEGVERSVQTPRDAPPLGGPSSFGRIEAALANGTIDDEQALTYKVFASFHDSRLPAELQGDDTGRFGIGILDTVRERFETLSPSTQVALEPFLIPPAYEGSWVGPTASSGAKPIRPTCLVRGSWKYAVGTSGEQRVRVWYEDSLFGGATRRANAEVAAKALETEIWPELIDNVKLAAPMSDLANICNGQSGALDVYLVGMGFFSDHAGYEGITQGSKDCHQSPVYILVNDDLQGEKLKAVLAHEFMHAVQWAYKSKACKITYGWLLDATANWAIDAVYPINDLEQEYAPWFLESPELSLDDMTRKNGEPDRAYGAYLFFQFLTRSLKRKDVVRAVWAATAGMTSSLEAVNASIPGGFEEQFPKFAKALWNQDPVNLSSFEGWDQMKLIPTTKEDDKVFPINLAGQPSTTTKLDGRMEKLAIHYYRFRLNDSNVRSVAFLNHFAAVYPVAPFLVTTQAFVKKAGSIWEWEDWSDGGLEEITKSFCIDRTDQRITELIIVMTNDSYLDDLPDVADQLPRVSASNVGCWRYKGTSSVTDHVVSNSTGDVVDEQVDATVTFDRVPVSTAYGEGNTALFFVKSGAVTGKSLGVGLCTTTQSGAGPMAENDGSLTVSLGLDLATGVLDRNVAAAGSSTLQTTVTMACGDVVVTNTGPGGWSWIGSPVSDDKSLEVAADGSISARFSEEYVGIHTGTRTTTINLAPLRQ